eukprot:gene41540-51452_t
MRDQAQRLAEVVSVFNVATTAVQRVTIDTTPEPETP